MALAPSPLGAIVPWLPPVAGLLPVVVLLLVEAVPGVVLGTMAPALPPVAGALPLVVELLVAAVGFVVASVLPFAPAP